MIEETQNLTRTYRAIYLYIYIYTYLFIYRRYAPVL